MSTPGESQRRELQRRRLDNKTYIVDEEHHALLMTIEGVLALPVGSVIELMDPRADAEVTRVGLFPGSDSTPVAVCLTVRLREVGFYSHGDANEFGDEWLQRLLSSDRDAP